MFCEKCGNQLENDVKFCTNCGNPVNDEVEINDEIQNEEIHQDSSLNEENISDEIAEEAPANENHEEIVSEEDVENVVSEENIPVNEPDNVNYEQGANNVPKVNTGLIKKIAIGAVCAVVTVGVIASAAPYVSNSFSKIVMSPSKYFRHVAKKNAKDISDSAAGLFANVEEIIPADNAVSGKFSIEKGEALDDIIGSLGDSYALEYIDWLKKADVEFEGAFTDDKASANLKVDLNDKGIASLETVMDMASEKMYIGIPDYNSTYIAGPMDMPSSPFANNEFSNTLNKLIKALPSEAKAEDILYKYITTATDEIDNVEESKDTLTISGISQKCTKLRAKLDGKTYAKIAKAVLTTFKKDKDIKKIVSGISKASDEFSEFENAYNEAMENIDSLIESTDELEDIQEEVTVSLWINGKGEIIGVSFKVDNEEMYVKYAQKGSKFGWEAGSNGSLATFKIEGNGKVSGDKHTGDFGVKVMGMEVVNLSVKNFDVEKLKKGIINGSISVKAADGLPLSMLGNRAQVLDDLEVRIKSNSESIKKSDLSLEILYDGKLCVKVSAESKVNNASGIKVPKKFVDAEDDNAMKEWANDTDFDKLIKRLKSAKLPSEIVEQLEEAIEQIK